LIERYGAHVRLDVIGDGDKSYIATLKVKIQEAQKRLGITIPVRWAGFKSRAELFKLFNIYDSLVLGSISDRPEPFGLVALEAMALGLPVIAPDFSGVSEIIEDGVNGLLAKIDDVDSFTEALWRLYTNPELAFNISRQARLTALENSASEKIVKDFQTAFSSENIATEPAGMVSSS
jgi:glycosyltransferase involved in cell wall biosynthesis